MMKRITSAVLPTLLLLPTLGLAQTGGLDVNRRADAVALIPGATGGVEVHAAWSVQRSASAASADMSLEVEFLLNGSSQTIIPVSNPASGSHLTSTHIAGAQVGDEISVILHALATATPETDASDDWKASTYHGQSTYWNRRISRVSVIPAQNPPRGTSGGTQYYDVWVEMTTETRGLAHDASFDTHLRVGPQTPGGTGGLSTLIGIQYEPANPAGCFGGGCFLTCGYWNGLPYFCDPNLFGECSCLNTWVQAVPNVPGLPGDELDVGLVLPPPEPPIVLVPVPGALPELPGFPEDDEENPTIPIDCRGDATGDAMVNFDDLNAVLANWNTAVLPGTDGDVNFDGFVDFADLNIVLSAWGTNCAPV